MYGKASRVETYKVKLHQVNMIPRKCILIEYLVTNLRVEKNIKISIFPLLIGKEFDKKKLDKVARLN